MRKTWTKDVQHPLRNRVDSGYGAIRGEQIPPLRYPEFTSRLAALANFMRVSLMKAAHVDLSDVAKQEFG